jgi:pimeloyl-ACP methyl ester carboxylesterase
VFAVFAVLFAAPLVVGCGPRDESTDRDTGTAAMTEAQTGPRTVGTVEAPDGVEIRYEAAGHGDPALVFVHGWSCDRSYWRAQMEHFAPSHRAVAVDLGGHGESGVGREEWTMAAFGADIRAVVDALELQKVVLVGHSMGGPVIVEAARLMPERVVALVSVDHFQEVGERMSDEERQTFLAPMRTDFRGTTEPWVRKFFGARADPGLVDRIARDMADAPPEVAVSAINHTFLYNDAAALAALNVPMRLINADIWHTDLEAARRHKPDMQLAVMPGVGHFLMIEAPDEFNRLLARAVSELPATP